MKILNSFTPNAHWFLRVAVASVFVFHGLGKFPNLGAMAAMMDMPVVRSPLRIAALTGDAPLYLGNREA